MKQQRVPITYFEKIGRIITSFVPDFFKKKYTYEEVSDAHGAILDKAKKINLKKPTAKKELEEHQKGLLGAIEFINNIDLSPVQKSLTTLENLKSKLKSGSAQDKKNIGYLTYSKIDIEAVEKSTLALDYHKNKLIDAVYAFQNNGSKIFRVEEDLFNELALTDCRKINTEFLLLPFPSVLFHIPYNNELKIRGEIVKWFHVMDCELDNGDILYNFLFISESGQLTPYEFKFADGDIESQIKITLEEQQWDSKQAKKELIATMSFFASLILYINSDDPDETHIAPSVLFKDKDSRLPVCSLGYKIKINKSLKAIYGSSEDSHKKSIHILKWTVRGHFRKQPCGKNRSENKIIWIRPYIKGKERDNEEIDFKPTIYELT